MHVCSNESVLCVNALWQSSMTKDGPRARNSDTWGENSLVKVLVESRREELKSLQKQRVQRANVFQLACVGKSIGKAHFEALRGRGSDFYTHQERVTLAVASKSVSAFFPHHFSAAKIINFLRRMAFAKTTAEVLERAGHGTCMKCTIAGEILEVVGKLNIERVIESPLPAFGRHNAKLVAVALAAIAANRRMDHESERAFLVLAKAAVSHRAWPMVKIINARLINWMQ